MFDLIIIILVCCLLYGRTIWYGLVVDDIKNYMHYKKRYEGPWKRKDIFSISRFKGSCCVLNPKIDHCVTLLIHIAVCCLINLVFNNIYVSLLFAVHPVNNQISCWLNGKRYGINAILALLIWWSKPIGMILYVFVPFWQVSALPIPFLYLLTPYWWFLPISLIILMFRYKKLKRWLDTRLKDIPDNELRKIHPKKLIIYVKTIGFYFCHCLFPRGIYMYHSFMYSFAMYENKNKEFYSFDKYFLRGLICLSIIFFLIIYYWATPISFGLIWWLLFISVFGNFYTVTMLFSDRVCYLPNIGLMLSLATYLNYIGLGHLTLLIIGWYASKMDAWMPMYKDERAFNLHHIFYDKGNILARIYEANYNSKINNYAQVFNIIHNGLTYCQPDAKLFLAAAACMLKMKKYMQCLLYCKKCKDLLIIGLEESFLSQINLLSSEVLKEVGEARYNEILVDIDKI